MRQDMPHRSNIDIEGRPCKGFLRQLRRHRLKSLRAEMQSSATVAFSLRFLLAKTIAYGDCQSADKSRAVADFG